MKKAYGLLPRVLLVWVVFTLALLVAGLLGGWLETSLGAPVWAAQLVRAVVLSGVVLSGIALTVPRQRREHETGADRVLGFTPPGKSLRAFFFGAAVVLFFVGLALALGVLTGELRIIGARVSLALIFALLWEAFIALFYEALPEELTFRGYLQGTLNTRLARWAALVLQVLLFVSAALAVAFSRQLLGVGAGVSGSGGVTPDYVILLLLFGIVLTLCRLVTGSVWASSGFHLTFLTLNPDVLGPDASAFVEVAESVPGTREFLLFFLGPIVGGASCSSSGLTSGDALWAGGSA